MKLLRRTKKPKAARDDKPASPPPPPSTATDWDLWMEKHASDGRAAAKPPASGRGRKKRRR